VLRLLSADFEPVSVRMAKEQQLSLNPNKISGICGRLMCCLTYEYLLPGAPEVFAQGGKTPPGP